MELTSIISPIGQRGTALASALVDHRNGQGDSVVDVVSGPVRNDRRGTDGSSSEANED